MSNSFALRQLALRDPIYQGDDGRKKKVAQIQKTLKEFDLISSNPHDDNQKFQRRNEIVTKIPQSKELSNSGLSDNNKMIKDQQQQQIMNINSPSNQIGSLSSPPLGQQSRQAFPNVVLPQSLVASPGSDHTRGQQENIQPQPRANGAGLVQVQSEPFQRTNDRIAGMEQRHGRMVDAVGSGGRRHSGQATPQQNLQSNEIATAAGNPVIFTTSLESSTSLASQQNNSRRNPQQISIQTANIVVQSPDQNQQFRLQQDCHHQMLAAGQQPQQMQHQIASAGFPRTEQQEPQAPALHNLSGSNSGNNNNMIHSGNQLSSSNMNNSSINSENFMVRNSQNSAHKEQLDAFYLHTPTSPTMQPRQLQHPHSQMMGNHQQQIMMQHPYHHPNMIPPPTGSNNFMNSGSMAHMQPFLQPQHAHQPQRMQAAQYHPQQQMMQQQQQQQQMQCMPSQSSSSQQFNSMLQHEQRHVQMNKNDPRSYRRDVQQLEGLTEEVRAALQGHDNNEPYSPETYHPQKLINSLNGDSWNMMNNQPPTQQMVQQQQNPQQSLLSNQAVHDHQPNPPNIQSQRPSRIQAHKFATDQSNKSVSDLSPGSADSLGMTGGTSSLHKASAGRGSQNSKRSVGLQSNQYNNAGFGLKTQNQSSNDGGLANFGGGSQSRSQSQSQDSNGAVNQSGGISASIFADNENQVSPKFPSNSESQAMQSKSSKSQARSDYFPSSNDENATAEQFFYSDSNIINGYIPAAGVGIANQEFQKPPSSTIESMNHFDQTSSFSHSHLNMQHRSAMNAQLLMDDRENRSAEAQNCISSTNQQKQPNQLSTPITTRKSILSLSIQHRSDQEHFKQHILALKNQQEQCMQQPVSSSSHQNSSSNPGTAADRNILPAQNFRTSDHNKARMTSFHNQQPPGGSDSPSKQHAIDSAGRSDGRSSNKPPMPQHHHVRSAGPMSHHGGSSSSIQHQQNQYQQPSQLVMQTSSQQHQPHMKHSYNQRSGFSTQQQQQDKRSQLFGSQKSGYGDEGEQSVMLITANQALEECKSAQNASVMLDIQSTGSKLVSQRSILLTPKLRIISNGSANQSDQGADSGDLQNTIRNSGRFGGGMSQISNHDREMQGCLKLLDKNWQAKIRASGRSHQNNQHNQQNRHDRRGNQFLQNVQNSQESDGKSESGEEEQTSTQRSLAQNYRRHKLKFEVKQVRVQNKKSTHRRKVRQDQMYQEIDAAKQNTCCISKVICYDNTKENRVIQSKRPEPVSKRDNSTCLIF